jgi:serine protease Do
MKITLPLILSFSIGLSSLQANPIWSEKSDQAPLVTLPSFAPIVEKLDMAVVNVQGTSEPKQDKEREKKGRPQRGPQQGPSDPFMNPDEFFEHFFGSPFRDQPQQPRRTLGSGFIISKDGYILTNNHVVEGADKIEISLLAKDIKKSNKKENKFPATVIGRDAATDVALLKIKADVDLPFAFLGNSSTIQKGEWVLAMGNPFGLDHSVSAGIVSAVGREISPNENRRFDDFIQTDAAINFGNSGGPLVNMKGEVVGINTAITAQGSGIGFAVPINIAKDVVTQLKEVGSVTRGYLGVMIRDVTDEMKEALGLSAAKGVLVNDIVAGGPASKSDLKRGDIILKVNDEEVNDAKSLQKAVAKVKPGSNVTLELIREKQTKKISVKVGNLTDGSKAGEKKSEEPEKADKLGLTVGSNKDGSGVQVEDVEPSSPALEAGIVPGDLVRRINGQDVKSLADYKKITGSLKSKQSVLFDVERGNTKLYIAFRVP